MPVISANGMADRQMQASSASLVGQPVMARFVLVFISHATGWTYSVQRKPGSAAPAARCLLVCCTTRIHISGLLYAGIERCARLHRNILTAVTR